MWWVAHRFYAEDYDLVMLSSAACFNLFGLPCHHAVTDAGIKRVVLLGIQHYITAVNMTEYMLNVLTPLDYVYPGITLSVRTHTRCRSAPHQGDLPRV